MIVDTHVHVVSPDETRYPFNPAGGFQAAGLGPWHRQHPVSAEQMLDTIAGAGVDHAIIVQPFSAYGFDNSYHADSAARHRPRLIGVCTVDPVSADGAERLAYWVRERGMTGLRITTSREGARLDDPLSMPLWDQIQALAIPVNLLTGPTHWGEVRTMAARYPSVPVLLDHAGGMGAGQTDEIADELASLADLPNVSLKVSTVNFAPLGALGDAGMSRWRRLAQRYGAERLLWGSNYPVSQEGSYADMVELSQRALPFLTDAERDLMMGENAARVYPQLRGQ